MPRRRRPRRHQSCVSHDRRQLHAIAQTDAAPLNLVGYRATGASSPAELSPWLPRHASNLWLAELLDHRREAAAPAPIARGPVLGEKTNPTLVKPLPRRRHGARLLGPDAVAEPKEIRKAITRSTIHNQRSHARAPAPSLYRITPCASRSPPSASARPLARALATSARAQRASEFTGRGQRLSPPLSTAPLLVYNSIKPLTYGSRCPPTPKSLRPRSSAPRR
jgi:hypothetical protein